MKIVLYADVKYDVNSNEYRSSYQKQKIMKCLKIDIYLFFRKKQILEKKLTHILQKICQPTETCLNR